MLKGRSQSVYVSEGERLGGSLPRIARYLTLIPIAASLGCAKVRVQTVVSAPSRTTDGGTGAVIRDGITLEAAMALEAIPRAGRISSERVDARSSRAMNGAAVSWDGRLLFQSPLFSGTALADDPDDRAAASKWAVRAFRPEALASGDDQAPIFSSTSFSPSLVVTMPAPEVQSMLTRAQGFDPDVDPAAYNRYLLGAFGPMAAVANPAVAENPYRSNDQGQSAPAGAYETYDVQIFAATSLTMLEKADPSRPKAIMVPSGFRSPALGFRFVKIIVEKPRTKDATVLRAFASSGFTQLSTVGGKAIMGIEPALTADGRLIIYQGNPKNDGTLGEIMVSWNPVPGAATGWTEPKSLPNLFADRATDIAGVSLGDRYPIAKNAFLDLDGSIISPGNPFHGAAPFIDPDGKNVFFTTMYSAVYGARKSGLVALGSWTGYAIRLADGPVNPDRRGNTLPDPLLPLGVAFSSPAYVISPGAFSSAWAPFHDVPSLPIPYLTQKTAYPAFIAGTGTYTELAFDDFVDGNYVLYFHMNEALKHGSSAPGDPSFASGSVDADPFGFAWDASRTFDSSGNANHGALGNGASFPFEYTAGQQDRNFGISGQAILFTDRSTVTVPHSASLGRLSSKVTASLFVKPLKPHDERRVLLDKPGQFQFGIEVGGKIYVSITGTDGKIYRTGSAGPTLPIGAWSSVAFVFDGDDAGALRTYVEAVPAGEVKTGATSISAGTGALVIGPANSASPLYPDEAVVVLDEIAISSVVRTADELADAALLKHRPPPVSTSALKLPLGLEKARITGLRSNLITPPVVALGQKLFSDSVLSSDRVRSCATCHLPTATFMDFGESQESITSRNSPTAANRAFSTRQFWDGRASTLEEQALLPIQNPKEMGLTLDEAISRLSDSDEYRRLFAGAFGERPSTRGLAFAIAAFERTILIGNSRVDQFEAGNPAALSAAEQRGRLLFRGKARCIACHFGPNYTDEDYHNVALLAEGPAPHSDTIDIGLGAITKRASDRGRFKTPSLRNVSQTHPYHHDGAIPSLEKMLALYNGGGDANNPYRDREMRPLGLTQPELDDLLAFLKALDGTMTFGQDSLSP